MDVLYSTIFFSFSLLYFLLANKIYDRITAVTIPTKIIFENHLNLQAKKDDGLPEIICTKCYGRLRVSYDFRKQTTASDKHLRTFIQDVNKKFQQVTNVTDDCLDEVFEENNIYLESDLKDSDEKTIEQHDLIVDETNLINILNIKNEKCNSMANYTTEEVEQIIEDERDGELGGHEVLISDLGEEELIEGCIEDEEGNDGNDSQYDEHVDDADNSMQNEQMYEEEHLDDQVRPHFIFFQVFLFILLISPKMSVDLADTGFWITIQR